MTSAGPVAMDGHRDGPILPVRAIIAVEHRLVRAVVRRLFEDQHDISIAGEAATGEQLLALVSRVKPDVVVMDVELPDADGFEVTRQVVARSPAGVARVVLLIDADSDDSMLHALEAGASGVLAMDSDAPELLRAVRVVAAGGSVLGPDVTRRVIAHLLSDGPRRWRVPAELSELTPREREIVGLVARGIGNAEIAERLVVTPSTVKTHVSRACRKVGARDRAQLVVFAYESGLVRPRSGGPDHHEVLVPGAAHGRWRSVAHDGQRFSR
ncbi:MAG TPA: response regulator transcription factor [Baekduia sp.]|uniref:response regulator transcription factor n=1 Tax=Baekduia sp. TaxID=2600305 RepID=UPI002B73A8A2|nr:response regulator transcription factor [Baekduia sp.]HMJ34264.1 response regulator transcription factor [Baekduia sp.]